MKFHFVSLSSLIFKLIVCVYIICLCMCVMHIHMCEHSHAYEYVGVHSVLHLAWAWSLLLTRAGLCIRIMMSCRALFSASSIPCPPLLHSPPLHTRNKHLVTTDPLPTPRVSLSPEFNRIGIMHYVAFGKYNIGRIDFWALCFPFYQYKPIFLPVLCCLDFSSRKGWPQADPCLTPVGKCSTAEPHLCPPFKFWDRVSPTCPGWSWTCNPTTSVSWIPGITGTWCHTWLRTDLY